MKIIRNNLLFIIMGVILLVVNYLYGESMTAAYYGLVLCAFMFFCISVIQMIEYRKKINMLKSIKNQPENMISNLPIPGDKEEQYYQDILNQIYQEKLDVEQKYQSKEQEMMDYYTRWIHQIKTPIAAMSLLIQSSDREKNYYKMEQELLLIEQYAKMALQYQNLHSGQNDLLLKKYDISQLVREVIKKFSYSFLEKKISMKYEDFTYSMVTDEKWFSFLIEQLISNAVKYTNEGYVAISFIEEPIPTLHIRDTGIGICEEDIPRIFEKGYTGYNGHMDKKATGIGLYMCKSVAERLGIKIRVESKIGEGSCFSLELVQELDEE